MKIDWTELLIKIAIGIFAFFLIGMSVYAMQNMSPTEKTNFILMFQQWE